MIDDINPLIKTLVLLIISFILGFSLSYRLNISVILIGILLLLSSRQAKLKPFLILFTPIFILSSSYFFAGLLHTNLESSAVKSVTNIIVSVPFTMGLIHSTRIVAYAILGILFSLTINKLAWLYSLMKYLRVSPYYAYSILISLNLIPMIKKEFENSKLSLRVRNYNSDNYKAHNFHMKVLVNMLIHSIRWSEIAAVSMESKGFQNKNRSYYINPRFTVFDFLFTVTSFGLFISALVYNF